MYIEKPEAVEELSQKEQYLAQIDSRIAGLNGTITHYEARVAYREHVEKIGQLFSNDGVIYPVDYDAINREIKRLKAARKDVMKRPN